MKKIKSTLILLILSAFAMASAEAVDDVAKVVALKGNVFIERPQGQVQAKVKDDVLLNDTVSTREESKTKILFIDDSVLTLGEKSKLVVKEFISSKDDRGKSVYNLLDGKIRTIVGRTNFEVHTPNVVVAARGTNFYVETGMKNNVHYSTVVCFEGVVDIKSIDASVKGTVILTPGMMLKVTEHQQNMPQPEKSTPSVLSATYLDSSTKTQDTGAPTMTQAQAIADTLSNVTAPPIPQQPPPPPPTSNAPANTTPVKINITFP
ncbi:MAG: FecR domain-containing protein [Nitrospirae bacterium]|nr:FecR domain-containing protein [Nitrospirota bacterium]MBF0535544.1 FecR domain-containing protein [Nitrospirota bacterium]MBF0617429.1 FecR domain-containing protein [Nitrospirota bacterium]